MKKIGGAILAAVSGILVAVSSATGPAGAAAGHASDQTSCRGWVALTFDDGPSSYRTKTLGTLREKRVPATFFDLGMRVAANPQFAGVEAGEGHLVLSHTWSHWDITLLSSEQLQSQLTRTEAVSQRPARPFRTSSSARRTGASTTPSRRS